MLITGAALGIGAETARTFAQNGYNVVINYLTHEKDARDLVAECERLGNGITACAIQADVTDESDVARLFDEAVAKVGQIDVLINNAANPNEPAFMDCSRADIIDSLTTNLVSAMLITQRGIRDALKRPGVVLNVASIYGLDQSGTPRLLLYSAAKAALINFTQTMAQAYAPDIRFNAVVPGYTRTPAWDGVPADLIKTLHDNTLQKEWVESDDVAQALFFLATAPHITAQTIIVDAGFSKKVT